MKTKKRFLSILLSLMLVLGLMPGMSLTAYADGEPSVTTDKVPGTGAIRDPGAPTDDGWNGSYVYYGNYDGSNPTKYRVLDKNAAEFGENTMFLDCDSILYYDSFNKNNSQGNVWAGSNVQTGLNGEKFLEKTGNFSDIEKAAIASSTVREHDLVKADDINKNEEGKVAEWTYNAFGKYVPLNKDKVFLLDAEDVSNIKYGYQMNSSNGPERIKKDQTGNVYIWWLRSANTVNYCAGCCFFNEGYWNGDLNRNDVCYGLGVSPAFNVDLDSVIFTSLIPETSNEYKLTLLDNNITITTANYSKSGDTVTVPYTLTGDHAENVTRISVLLTDEPYSPGTDMTDGYAYEKLDVKTDGTGTFTIPDSFKDKEWGEDYHVYILAEDENDGKETDYASAPAELYTVDETKIRAKVTGYEGIYDGYEHGIDIKVTRPANGATVKYGEEEGTYNLDASPVITDVSDSPKTVYYKISASGYKDSFGSSQIKIEKASSALTAPEAKTGLVYDGGEQELVSSGKAEGGTMQYALGTDDKTAPTTGWSTSIPKGTDVRTYYVWYKAVGDDNHVDADPASVAVNIAQKGVGLAWSNTKLTYNGKSQKPSASATGLVKGDVCTVTVTGKKTKPGNYTATASKLGNSNYRLPKANTTAFSIVKAAQAAPAAPAVSRTTLSAITVKTVSGVEYSLDGKTWQKSGTFKNLVSNTKYKVYARRKETSFLKASPASKAASAKTKEMTNKLALDRGLLVTQTGSRLNVKWGYVDEADSFEVYAQYDKKKFGKTATVTVKGNKTCLAKITKINGKALDLTGLFRVVVVAKKGDKTLAKSLECYVAGRKNRTRTNAKGIELEKTAVTLKAGKSARVNAKIVSADTAKKQLGSAYGAELRYETTDERVASVDKNGKITAQGKGKCTVYVFTRSGAAGKVAVTVK